MKEIERIKTEKVWQKGLSKEYYTELTDAIRTYIKDRFGFNALEMTSSEIIDQLLEMNDKEAMRFHSIFSSPFCHLPQQPEQHLLDNRFWSL